MSAHEPTPDPAQERPPVEEVIEELRHNAAQADPFLEMTLDDGVAWLTDLRARVRELEAARERLRVALRQIEHIAAEHEGVNPHAYELITDEIRAALAASPVERGCEPWCEKGAGHTGNCRSFAGGAEGDTP